MCIHIDNGQVKVAETCSWCGYLSYTIQLCYDWHILRINCYFMSKISRLSNLQCCHWVVSARRICDNGERTGMATLRNFMIARSKRAAYGCQCHVVTTRQSQDWPLRNRNLAVTWFMDCRPPVLQATVHRRTGPLRHSQTGWMNTNRMPVTQLLSSRIRRRVVW